MVGFQQTVICQKNGITSSRSPSRKPNEGGAKRSKHSTKVTPLLNEALLKNPSVEKKTILKAKQNLTPKTACMTGSAKSTTFARDTKTSTFSQSHCKEFYSDKTQAQLLTKTALPTLTPPANKRTLNKKSVNLATRQKTVITETHTFSKTEATIDSYVKNIPYANVMFRQYTESNESDSYCLHEHSSPISNMKQSVQKSSNVFNQIKIANKTPQESSKMDLPEQSQSYSLVYIHSSLYSRSLSGEAFPKITSQNFPILAEKAIPLKSRVGKHSYVISTGSSEFLDTVSNSVHEDNKTYTLSSKIITNSFSPVLHSETNNEQQSSQHCLMYPTCLRNVGNDETGISQRLVLVSQPRMPKTRVINARYGSDVRDLGNKEKHWDTYVRVKPVSKIHSQENKFLAHLKAAARKAASKRVENAAPLQNGRGRLKPISGNKKQGSPETETTEETKISKIKHGYSQVINGRSMLKTSKKHENYKPIYRVKKKPLSFTSSVEESIHMIESLLSLVEVNQPTTTHKDVERTPPKVNRKATTSFSSGGLAVKNSLDSSTPCSRNLNPRTQLQESFKSSSNLRRNVTKKLAYSHTEGTKSQENIEHMSVTTDVSSPIEWNSGNKSLQIVTENHQKDHKFDSRRAPTKSTDLHITFPNMPPLLIHKLNLKTKIPVKSPHPLNKSVISSKLTNSNPSSPNFDPTSQILTTRRSSTRSFPSLSQFLNNVDSTTKKLHEQGKFKGQIGKETDIIESRKLLKHSKIPLKGTNQFFQKEKLFTEEMQRNKCDTDIHSTSISVSRTDAREIQFHAEYQDLQHTQFSSPQEVEGKSQKAESMIISKDDSTYVTNVLTEFMKDETLSTEKVNKVAVDSAVITASTKRAQKIFPEKLSTNIALKIVAKKCAERKGISNLKSNQKPLNSESDKDTAPTNKKISDDGGSRQQNGRLNMEFMKSKTMYISAHKFVSGSKYRKGRYSLKDVQHSTLDEASKKNTLCNMDKSNTKHVFHKHTPCMRKGSNKIRRRSRIPVKKCCHHLKTGKLDNESRQKCKLPYPEDNDTCKTEFMKEYKLPVPDKAPASNTKINVNATHDKTLKTVNLDKTIAENDSTVKTNESKVVATPTKKTRSKIPIKINEIDRNELSRQISSSQKTHIYHQPISAYAAPANGHSAIVQPHVVTIKQNVASINSGLLQKQQTLKVSNTNLNIDMNKKSISNHKIEESVSCHQESPPDLIQKKNTKTKELSSYQVHTVDNLHKEKLPEPDKQDQQTQNVEESPVSSSTNPVLSAKSTASASCSLDVMKRDEPSYTSKYKSHDNKNLKLSWRGTNAFRKRLQYLLQHNKNTRNKEKYINKNLLLSKGIGRRHKNVGLLTLKKDIMKVKSMNTSEMLAFCSKNQAIVNPTANKKNTHRIKQGNATDSKKECDQNVRHDNNHENKVDTYLNTLQSSQTFETAMRNTSSEREGNQSTSKKKKTPFRFVHVKTNINTVSPTTREKGKSLSDVSSRSLITELGRDPRSKKLNQNVEHSLNKKFCMSEELQSHTNYENENDKISPMCKTRNRISLSGLQRTHKETNRQLASVLSSWLKRQNTDVGTVDDEQKKISSDDLDSPSQGWRCSKNLDHEFTETDTSCLSRWDQLISNDKVTLKTDVSVPHFGLDCGKEDLTLAGTKKKSRGTMTDKMNVNLITAKSEPNASEVLDLTVKNSISGLSQNIFHRQQAKVADRQFRPIHKINDELVQEHSESFVPKRESVNSHHLVSSSFVEDGTTKITALNYPMKQTTSCTVAALFENYNHESINKKRAPISPDLNCQWHCVECDIESRPVSKPVDTEVSKTETPGSAAIIKALCDCFSKLTNVKATPATVSPTTNADVTLAKDLLAKNEAYTEPVMTSRVSECDESVNLFKQTTNAAELQRRGGKLSNQSPALDETKLSSTVEELSQMTNLLSSTEHNAVHLSDWRPTTMKVVGVDTRESKPLDNQKKFQNNGYKPRNSERFFVPAVMSEGETSSFDNSNPDDLCETLRLNSLKQPAAMTRFGTRQDITFSSCFAYVQNKLTRNNICSAKLTVNPQSANLSDNTSPILQDLEDLVAKGSSVGNDFQQEGSNNLVLADSNAIGVLTKNCSIDLADNCVGRELRSESYNGPSCKRNHFSRAQLKRHFKEDISQKCKTNTCTNIKEDNFAEIFKISSSGLVDKRENYAASDCPIQCATDVNNDDNLRKGTRLPAGGTQVNCCLKTSHDKMNVIAIHGHRHNHFLGHPIVTKSCSTYPMIERTDSPQTYGARSDYVLADVRNAGTSTKTQNTWNDFKNIKSLVNDTVSDFSCMDIESKLDNVHGIALENCTGCTSLNISTSQMFTESKSLNTSPVYYTKPSHSQNERYCCKNIALESPLAANVNIMKATKYKDSNIAFKDAYVSPALSTNSGCSIQSRCRLSEPVVPSPKKKRCNIRKRRPSWIADGHVKVSDISCKVQKEQNILAVSGKREEQDHTILPLHSVANQIKAVEQLDKCQSLPELLSMCKPSEQSSAKTRIFNNKICRYFPFVESEIDKPTQFNSNHEKVEALVESNKGANIKSWNTNELTNDKRCIVNEDTFTAKTQYSPSDDCKSTFKENSLPCKKLRRSRLKKQMAFVSPSSSKFDNLTQNKSPLIESVVSHCKKCLRLHRKKSPCEAMDIRLNETEMSAVVPVLDMTEMLGVKLAGQKDDNMEPAESDTSCMVNVWVKKSTANNTKEFHKSKLSTKGKASTDSKYGDTCQLTEIVKTKYTIQQHAENTNIMAIDSKFHDSNMSKVENPATHSRRHENSVKYDKSSSKRQTDLEALQKDAIERNMFTTVDDLESLLNKELVKARIGSGNRKKHDAIFNLQHENKHDAIFNSQYERRKRNTKRKRSRKSCSPMSCHMELHYHFRRENDGSVKGTSSNTSQQTAVCTNDVSTSTHKRPRRFVRSVKFAKLEEFIQRAEEASKNKQDFTTPSSETKVPSFAVKISSNQNLYQPVIHSETDSLCPANECKKRKLDTVIKGNCVASKKITEAIISNHSYEIIEAQNSKTKVKHFDESTLPRDRGTIDSSKEFYRKRMSYSPTYPCHVYKSESFHTTVTADVNNEALDSLKTHLDCDIRAPQTLTPRKGICNEFESASVPGRRVSVDSFNMKVGVTSMKFNEQSLHLQSPQKKVDSPIVPYYEHSDVARSLSDSSSVKVAATSTKLNDQSLQLQSPQQNMDSSTVAYYEHYGVADSLSESSSSIVLSWFDVIDPEATLPNSPQHSYRNLEKLSKTEAQNASPHAHP